LQPAADDPVPAAGTPAAGDALTKIPKDPPGTSGPKKARRPRPPAQPPDFPKALGVTLTMS
jgi:hypothetical protein